MLLGKQDSKIEYDGLSQYIEGWLHYKENKKYERFWFVLRGNIIHGRDLCTAYLFCFKDLNIHVEDNVVGSVEIHSHDKVELLKCGGNKPMKCDFTILLSETKFHFRADDEISRERWIYALCDLIGKCQPPSELPTERNKVRASSSLPLKKTDKKGAFHRSKTVELPTTGSVPGRSSIPSTSTTGPASLRRSQTVDVVDSPPVVPPPRSVFSLPFMLDPHAQLYELKWFYPGMKREEAQEKLSTYAPGYYLLRDSESKVGSYTLTFKDTDRIKNHMITQSSDRQYRFHNSEIDMAFPSPQKAVEFYMIKKHSKIITPVPYCANGDGSDNDYLLPAEVNVSSQSGKLHAHKYTHRELPPTPGNLSIQDDVHTEDYLCMRDGKPSDYRKTSTQHLPTEKDNSKMKYNEIARNYVTTDDANGYLEVGGPSSYANDSPTDDSESYLEIGNPQKSCKTSEEDSDSDDEPEYFEYEKFDAGKPNSKYINTDAFDRGPNLPAKPACHFAAYDSVRLKDYENQNAVDGATMEAPSIPPRSIKPELPPRKSTVYRT